MRSARIATSAASAAGRSIEAAEQFLPARLGSVVDLARRQFVASVALHRATASSTRCRSGPKSSASARKNAALSCVREAAVAGENLARQRHA